MGEGILCEWGVGIGFEPPPPEAPDCYKIFVKYRGGWRSAWHFEECGTSRTLANMPNGCYDFDPRGTKDGVYSAYVAENVFTYIHTTGTDPIAPVYDDDPPAGDSSVAGPENFTATAAA